MSRPDEPTGSDSFAAMFEADARNKPRKTAVRGYRPGDSVEGTVIRVGSDAVYLDLGGAAEGYLEAHELRDHETGTMTVAMGDKVRAIVTDAHEDGMVKLGKMAPKGRGAEGLNHARMAGLAVEGLVSGINKGGLEVTVDGIRCFCPAKSVDTRFVSDLNEYVGQKLQFLVTQVKNTDVVLSRRALLDREQADARAAMASKLVPGAVLEGRVTSTRDFGAFVDLGGVEALLPASELSHDRSLRPADVVKVGDTLKVQVLDVGPDEKRPGQQRITLSLKALAGDPWDTVDLQEGAVKEGRVVRVAAFGAFVQLAPGLDGLLHVSEMSGELDDKGQPTGIPKVGDVISVRIVKVDREQRRVGLAPEGAPRRPARAGGGGSKLAQGMVVTGKVSSVEKFGVFVQLDGGRGLIPAAEVEKRGGDLIKQFPIGSEVRAKITAVDATGKIRLSVQGAKNEDERSTFEDFRAREQDRGASSGKLGSLGAKLQQALKAKK